jgi:pyruvate/2-oxoglutarate/acetoin dehydrogenase E1 component
VALAAADLLAEKGIDVEVIDPRTIVPLDEDTILESVRKTGRLVVVDEDHPRCSMATDLAALAVSKAFDYLDAPVRMVTPPNTPVPFSPPLEQFYVPNEGRVVEAVLEITGAHARV